MKKETLKELGKGFITFGNSVGALSIVYGLFNKNTEDIPVPPISNNSNLYRSYGICRWYNSNRKRS